MKTITILSFVLCLLTVSVRGQSELPFKGANRIIFICSDSTTNIYNRLGQHLISKGFFIESNKDFLNIKTKERSLSRYSGDYVINCSIQDNRILFTMGYSADLGGFGSVRGDWKYAKHETLKVLHDDFIKAMEGFDRIKTIYEKY